ncbi:MAG: hypothetical protein U0T82_01765 [Bacteroidales bacterium]
MESQSFPVDYLPLVFQLIVALGFVVLVMVLTHIIGGKRRRIRTLNKEENFECGIEVKGNARSLSPSSIFLWPSCWYISILKSSSTPGLLNFRELGWQDS